MIDTTKPIRCYNSKVSEKDRVYFIVDSIITDNEHIFACNIIGEPKNYYLFNKFNHKCISAAHKNWITENYEISNFPEPEFKFINAIKPLEVNYDLLANWQKNKLCSQIQAWSLENNPERSLNTKNEKNFLEKLSNIFSKKLEETITEEQAFLFKEYWKNSIFIRDCFSEESLTKIDKYVTSINVISSLDFKSVKIPVYHIVFSKGVEIMFYSNFTQYFISVISNKHNLEIPMELLDKPYLRMFAVDCPGFKQEWILDPYTENKKQFTATMNYSENQFFTFLFLLHLQLKKND